MNRTSYEALAGEVRRMLADLRETVEYRTPVAEHLDQLGHRIRCRYAALVADLARLAAAWREMTEHDRPTADAKAVVMLFAGFVEQVVRCAQRLCDTRGKGDRGAELAAMLDGGLHALRQHEGAFARAMLTLDPERREGGAR